MAVPDKYQHMCSFYKYYSGERKAPILTIFIGGNHEASNYLQELPYGGWVAPNIYYLGRAGVVKFGNLRIGGLSGIYKGQDYLQGHWECLPYSQCSMRTVYHIRSIDVFRLSQLKDKVHVMLSHDWPRGITDYGDTNLLLKYKPFLREDIESNQLGSVPAMKLLHTLKPDYWFAAHLHCQYAALIGHDNGETKFLALDKCLPKRKHLQILNISSEFDGDMCLKYDEEWLAILKNTNHLLTVKNVNIHLPGPGGNERYDFTPTEHEKAKIVEVLGSVIIRGDSFVRTAAIHDPNMQKVAPTVPILNPQTVSLCEKLGIDDPVQVLMARSGRIMKEPCDNGSIWEEPTPAQVVQTPQKPLKMSLQLPEPVTPSASEVAPKIFSPGTTPVSDSLESTFECKTPMSGGPKKTFKRRNLSIYNTPECDESNSTETSSLLDSDSPKCSKLLFRKSYE
ncbi:lariat debranching enzyme isoform X2 [Trichoplusia ni]|nr:lariat debranching enzyme isoform X2 [Trichoplusia ni]